MSVTSKQAGVSGNTLGWEPGCEHQHTKVRAYGMPLETKIDCVNPMLKHPQPNVETPQPHIKTMLKLLSLILKLH